MRPAPLARRRSIAVGTDPGPRSGRDGEHGHAPPASRAAGPAPASDPVCLGPDAPVSRARELLLDRRMPGVPVVDEDGRPLGIVTRTDLLAADEREGAADGDAGGSSTTTVADVMTAMVFALPASASLEQVAALIAYEGIQQVVITDDCGKVVGLVSSLDIARWCAQSAGYLL